MSWNPELKGLNPELKEFEFLRAVSLGLELSINPSSLYDCGLPELLFSREPWVHDRRSNSATSTTRNSAMFVGSIPRYIVRRLVARVTKATSTSIVVVESGVCVSGQPGLY